MSLRKLSILIFSVAAFTFMGCSTSKCKIEERPPVEIKGTEKTMTEVKDLTSRVQVYKPDGSLQCGQGAKVGLDVMAKQLGGIEVFKSDNKHDGLMRVQMCGHPTGTCNVYEILAADLEKAQKLGFKKWTKD